MKQDSSNIHHLLPGTEKDEYGRKQQKTEVVSLVRNLYRSLEKKIEEDYQIEITVGDFGEEYKEVLKSTDELEGIEPDYDTLKAELETEKGLRTEIDYRSSKKFPEDFPEAESYRKLGNGILVKYGKPRFPPELTVEVERSEEYDSKEMEKIEKGVEAFADVYRQLV